MILGDIDGNFITLESSTLEAAMNDGSVDQITVTASYNKGTVISKTLPVPVIRTWQGHMIPINSFTQVNQVYIRNIITEQKVALLTLPIVIHNTYAVSDFLETISQALIALGITTAIQDTNITDGGAFFTHIVDGLPSNIAMDTLEYEVSGLDVVVHYSLQEDLGLLINTNILYITPTFFGLSEFVEGIYNITLLVHVELGYLANEVGCYFLDKSLKCRLNATTDFSCGADKAYLQYLMLHYSLVAASNCQCDCEKMHTIFQYLNKQLPLNPNTEDCGCY